MAKGKSETHTEPCRACASEIKSGLCADSVWKALRLHVMVHDPEAKLMQSANHLTSPPWQRMQVWAESVLGRPQLHTPFLAHVNAYRMQLVAWRALTPVCEKLVLRDHRQDSVGVRALHSWVQREEDACF